MAEEPEPQFCTITSTGKMVCRGLREYFAGKDASEVENSLLLRKEGLNAIIKERIQTTELASPRFIDSVVPSWLAELLKASNSANPYALGEKREEINESLKILYENGALAEIYSVDDLEDLLPQVRELASIERYYEETIVRPMEGSLPPEDLQGTFHLLKCKVTKTGHYCWVKEMPGAVIQLNSNGRVLSIAGVNAQTKVLGLRIIGTNFPLLSSEFKLHRAVKPKTPLKTLQTESSLEM